MSNYKHGGFEKKYIITKVNGKPTDPEARYFVLRYDKDPHALVALAAYAQSVRSDNKDLARELAIIVQAENCLKVIGKNTIDTTGSCDILHDGEM